MFQRKGIKLSLRIDICILAFEVSKNVMCSALLGAEERKLPPGDEKRRCTVLLRQEIPIHCVPAVVEMYGL